MSSQLVNSIASQFARQMADDDENQESAEASDEEEEAEEEEDAGEANVLSIENEASSPNELDSQAVDEILANFESK